MIVRALLAAAAALLIGGDAARLGAGAFTPWRFCWPWAVLFLLLERERARRRVGSDEAFLAGAAAALAYAGVYSKDLQHGLLPLGVDWLAAAGAAFDGGFVAVAALHALAVLRPRRPSEGEPGLAGVLALAAALATLAAAAVVYALRTAFGVDRVDRLLGDGWLAADIGFLLAAWFLVRQARRGGDREDPAPGALFPVLSTLAVAAPAARLGAVAAESLELPSALAVAFAAAGAAGLGWLSWRLWRDRQLDDPPETAYSRWTLAAAVWRGAGALAVWSWLPPADPRAPAAFSTLVELPARAVFAVVLLSSRPRI